MLVWLCGHSRFCLQCVRVLDGDAIQAEGPQEPSAETCYYYQSFGRNHLPSGYLLISYGRQSTIIYDE